MTGLVKKGEGEVEAYCEQFFDTVDKLETSFVDEYGNKVYYTTIFICFEDKDGNLDMYHAWEVDHGIKRPLITCDKNGNETHYQRWKDNDCIDFTIDKDGNRVKYKEDGVTVAYTKDKNGKFTYYDGKDVKPVLEGDVPGYVYFDAQISDHVGKDGKAKWANGKNKDAHAKKKQTATALKVQKESQLVKEAKGCSEALIQNGQFAWVAASQKKMTAKTEQKAKSKVTSKTKTTAKKEPIKTNGGRT